MSIKKSLRDRQLVGLGYVDKLSHQGYQYPLSPDVPSVKKLFVLAKPVTVLVGHFVYLVHAEGTNRYKIGYSSEPGKRFSNIKTGSPVPLRLLAVKPGDTIHEKEIHSALAQYRWNGEWFEVPDRAIVMQHFTGWEGERYLGLVRSHYTKSTERHGVVLNMLLDKGRRYWYELSCITDNERQIGFSKSDQLSS